MPHFHDYFDDGPVKWTSKHLLGLEYLTAEEITLILDQAAEFKRLAASGDSKLNLLKGVVVGNRFLNLPPVPAPVLVWQPNGFRLIPSIFLPRAVRFPKENRF